LLLLAGVAAGVGVWRWRREPALAFAARDFVLLADLDNQTGDPLFDQTLSTALAVSLGQSTHANLVPRRRVADALRRMGRPPDTRVTEELGREICVREQVRGLVHCALGRVGDRYVLSARIIDPQTGEAVRSYQETVAGEGGLLDALGEVATAVRRDLGESLAAVRQANRPLPLVTTASLAALKLYVDGQTLWNQSRYPEAVRQYEAAVERDPDFAMAHAALAAAYMSHVFTQVDKGKAHAEKALRLAERTTDRERAYIEATTQADLGRQEEAARLYRIYLTRWPDDLPVRQSLAYLLMRMERPEEAAREYESLLEVQPGNGTALINLATSYSKLRRLPEAIRAYERAFAAEPDRLWSGTLAHEFGFALVAAGEPGKARELFDKGLARPETRARALRSLGLLEMTEGRYARAQDLFAQAALENEARGATLGASRDRLMLALVLRERGRAQEGRLQLGRAQKLIEAGPQPVWALARVGVYQARYGDAAAAGRLLARVERQADLAADLERALLHWLEGELALTKGQADRAAERIELALREGRGLPPEELHEGLARAHEAGGRASAAVAQYEALTGGSPPGFEPLAGWLAAHLRLARSYHQMGEVEKARRVLSRLLGRWEHGDADLPVLQAARRLQTQLGPAPPGPG
jgi:tetratricopeptide (TPR) repeat protein